MPEKENLVNPQSTSTQPSPVKAGINWLYILIGVVVGALLVGTGWFVYNSSQSKPKESIPPTTTTKTSTSSANPAPQTSPPATKDETADWLAYENQDFGFRFKYPGNSNWKLNVLDQQKIGSNVTGILTSFDVWYATPNTGGFTMTSYSNTLEYQLNDYRKNQCNGSDVCEIVSEENIKKFGAAGVKITYKNTYTKDISYGYFLSHKGKTYVIYPNSEATNLTLRKEIQATADKILDSLEFF